MFLFPHLDSSTLDEAHFSWKDGRGGQLEKPLCYLYGGGALHRAIGVWGANPA